EAPPLEGARQSSECARARAEGSPGVAALFCRSQESGIRSQESGTRRAGRESGFSRSLSAPGLASSPRVLLLVVAAVCPALDAFPPLLVVLVPADRGLERFGPRRTRGGPAQLALDLARIDRVAEVMAGAVFHWADHVLALAHDF